MNDGPASMTIASERIVSTNKNFKQVTLELNVDPPLSEGTS